MSVKYLKAAAVLVAATAQPLAAQGYAYFAEHALESYRALAPSIAAAEFSWSTVAPSLAATQYVQAFSAMAAVRSSSEWFPQDTADAVYRRARTALNGRNYQQAIDLLRTLRNQYAQSRYVICKDKANNNSLWR